MNKHLEQLIELSGIDKEIDAFEPQIEEANHKYETILATQDSIKSQIEQLQNETKDEQIKKQKNELHRITSYNVCYTKLLRRFGTDLHNEVGIMRTVNGKALALADGIVHITAVGSDHFTFKIQYLTLLIDIGVLFENIGVGRLDKTDLARFRL